MDNNKQNGFSYTYSAEEQEELKRIRAKYIPEEKGEDEDKMERLRKLDGSVAKTAQLVALTVGIIGTLILGFGMSLCMTDIGAVLGMDGSLSIIVGIVTGVLGGAAAAVAYPIYNAIVRIKQRKLAPEIIRLTDELMK